MRKFILLLLAIVASFAPAAFAQSNYLNITTTNGIVDASGTPMVQGTFCVYATDATDSPIAFEVASTFQAVKSTVCRNIVGGTLASSLQLANPAVTTPVNIRYHVTITNTLTRVVTQYPAVSIIAANTATSWDWSSWNPSLSQPSIPQNVVVGPPGANGANGANGTTPVLASVNVSNGSTLGGTWSGCPAACVLNLTITAGTSYRGAWAASTAYNVGDIVNNGGSLYIAPAAFTSSSSFNSANWNVFPSSGYTGTVNAAAAPAPAIYPAAGTAVSPGTFGLGYALNPLNQVDSENVISGFNGVDCNGDSITQAYGLPGVSTPAYSTPGGYCNYLANDIGGGLYRTLGQVGDSSADLSLKMLMYSPTVNDANNPLSIILIGKNDQTYLASPTLTQESYYQMYLSSAAAWKAIPNSRKYLATNWTQSAGTFTLPQTVLYNTTFIGGSTYAVGDRITLTCTGGTGPTYTVGSAGGSGNITSLTLYAAGSGCTNVGTFPSTTYPTTTTGSGTGATVTAFIGLVQPEIGTTVGSKLTQGSFYVPPSGVVYLWYAQYASSAGAGQFSIDGGSPLVDTFTGSSTLSAQWNGLGPRNSLAGGVVVALARFTGITPGIHSSAVWTQTAAGNAGIFGMGVPPTVHLRGSSGAHAIIGGVIPNQFSSPLRPRLRTSRPRCSIASSTLVWPSC